jgi:hypothetical protein
LFQTTSRKVRKIGRSAAVKTPAPLPRERVVPLVADHPAVPEDPLVVEQHDVRPPGRVDPGRDRLQRARQVQVVGVQEQHVLAAAFFQPGVPGRPEADVLLQVQHPHPRVGGGVLVQDPPGPVQVGVVHPDHLEVGERLAQHGVQARPQPRPRGMTRNHDAELGDDAERHATSS